MPAQETKAVSALTQIHPGPLRDGARVWHRDLVWGWKELRDVAISHLSWLVRKLSLPRGKKLVKAILQEGSRADSRMGLSNQSLTALTTAPHGCNLFHKVGLKDKFPKHGLKGHYQFCKCAGVTCWFITSFISLGSLSELSHENKRHDVFSFSRFLSPQKGVDWHFDWPYCKLSQGASFLRKKSLSHFRSSWTLCAVPQNAAGKMRSQLCYQEEKVQVVIWPSEQVWRLGCQRGHFNG